MNRYCTILLLAFSGSAFAGELTLSCEKCPIVHFYFVFDDSSDSVKQFFSNTAKIRYGKYEKTDTNYKFHFPKGEGFYETRVFIDRFSGKMNWESGSPPFGANLNNSYLKAQCKKILNKPLF